MIKCPPVIVFLNPDYVVYYEAWTLHMTRDRHGNTPDIRKKKVVNKQGLHTTIMCLCVYAISHKQKGFPAKIKIYEAMS